MAGLFFSFFYSHLSQLLQIPPLSGESAQFDQNMTDRVVEP